MNYIIFIFTFVAIVLLIMVLKTLRLPMTLRKVEEYLAGGDLPKASELIRRLSLKRKDYPPVRYLRARLLMLQGQYILSISEYNTILSQGGFDKFFPELDIHYKLAELYGLTKNYSKEIDEYKAILIFNSDDIVANQRLGYAFYQQGNFKNARDNLLKAVLLRPELTELYQPLGVSCFHASDYQKAELYLLKSLEYGGSRTEAEYYLGLIYSMKKDNENAISMLEKAKEDRRFLLGSLHALGQIRFDMEDYSGAIEYLERGLNNLKRNDEESLAYRYLLAECFELENKIVEAVHHWSKIEEENPNYRSTKLKLDSYRQILDNANIMAFFQASMEEMQPYITDIIAGLNFNIVSNDRISVNEYQYRAYNIKRINDPPVLVYFNRTTREISEGQIIDFYKRINNEKCKSGIYITTSKFSLRAKSSASSKMIDLYDFEFVNRSMEKIKSRKKNNK